jgi:hypothetical protein
MQLFSPICRGIRFGCAKPAPVRSDDMTTHTPRQRERRQAFGDLLAALARGLGRHNDVALLRGLFEEMVRKVVPVRTIHLREIAGRWTSQRALPPGAESIALEVPGADATSTGVLEATFDPGSRMGEWDFQMLGLATHIGALVLEIERTRLQLMRAGAPPAARPRRDGAAPLIGSTVAMQGLRTTIERVSRTDFTVLLEGPSDPQ